MRDFFFSNSVIASALMRMMDSKRNKYQLTEEQLSKLQRACSEWVLEVAIPQYKQIADEDSKTV